MTFELVGKPGEVTNHLRTIETASSAMGCLIALPRKCIVNIEIEKFASIANLAILVDRHHHGEQKWRSGEIFQRRLLFNTLPKRRSPHFIEITLNLSIRQRLQDDRAIELGQTRFARFIFFTPTADHTVRIQRFGEKLINRNDRPLLLNQS